MKQKRIGSDRSFKLLAMSALLFSRYVWISRKTKISFKTRPNIKKTYWSMMIMHIIFDFMGNDLQNWFLTYSWLELRWNTCQCEIYTPLTSFPLFEWIQCFLLLLFFFFFYFISSCMHLSLTYRRLSLIIWCLFLIFYVSPMIEMPLFFQTHFVSRVINYLCFGFEL